MLYTVHRVDSALSKFEFHNELREIALWFIKIEGLRCGCTTILLLLLLHHKDMPVKLIKQGPHPGLLLLLCTYINARWCDLYVCMWR